jgi:perosamine synthetase
LDLHRKDIKPITEKEAIYLRLPVMVRDREMKEMVCRRSREVGAGLSPNYPATIQEIPELAGRLAGRKFAGAQEVVDRLVTLPTHLFVTEGDRLKISRILENRGPSYRPIHSDGPKTADSA